MESDGLYDAHDENDDDDDNDDNDDDDHGRLKTTTGMMHYLVLLFYRSF